MKKILFILLTLIVGVMTISCSCDGCKDCKSCKAFPDSVTEVATQMQANGFNVPECYVSPKNDEELLIKRYPIGINLEYIDGYLLAYIGDYDEFVHVYYLANTKAAKIALENVEKNFPNYVSGRNKNVVYYGTERAIDIAKSAI